MYKCDLCNTNVLSEKANLTEKEVFTILQKKHLYSDQVNWNSLNLIKNILIV